MILRNFTIKKIFPLAMGKSSEGREWKSRDVLLKDEFHEFGDELVVTLKDEKATDFNLLVGDLVNASVRLMAHEYTDTKGAQRANTGIKCWRMEPVNTKGGDYA